MYEARPETLRVAAECRAYGLKRGNTGAGLLLCRLRRGDHFEYALDWIRQQEASQRRTGWRYARGTHGETWVRDPEGNDTPPRNYQ